MSVPRRPPSICAPPDVNASSTCSVGASVSDDDSLVWWRTWKRVSLKKFRRHRARLRQAEHVLGRVARVGARGKIEVADAEVAAAGAVALIARAQRVRLGQRVVDPRREVRAVRGPADAAGDVLLGQRGVERLRVIGVDAVAREGEARAVLLQRAAHRERAVLLLLGRPARREGVPRVHRFVAEREVDRSPQRAAARTRHDVHEHQPAAVVLGREESRRKRIDCICDLGGSRPPRNPSTRIVAPGPAISFKAASMSSGSSGSASICSRVSRFPNALPARIERAVARVLADRRRPRRPSRGRASSRAACCCRHAAAGRPSASARTPGTPREPSTVRARAWRRPPRRVRRSRLRRPLPRARSAES